MKSVAPMIHLFSLGPSQLNLLVASMPVKSAVFQIRAWTGIYHWNMCSEKSHMILSQHLLFAYMSLEGWVWREGSVTEAMGWLNLVA